MLVRLFRSAGATGHVFFLKNGRTKDCGLAYSGFIGPKTTVAVVPTTPQIIDFAIGAQTKDKQTVTVSGNLTVSLVPKAAVSRFDFTVDAKRGGYAANWLEVLKARVLERVLRAVHAKAAELDVEAATRAQKDVEEAVTVALGQDAFRNDGIVVDSCSIQNIEPDDEDVQNAIGAGERETLLADADKALHERRLQGAQNERAIKRYEAETALKLEGERTKLIRKQGENEKKKAKGDADAAKIRLEPFTNVAAGNLLGAALMEGFKSGRVNSVVIGPELLGALQKH